MALAVEPLVQKAGRAYAPAKLASAPWVVSVIHKINLIPMLARRDIKAYTLDGSAEANAVTFNFTTGLVLDREGHILTRLINLNPANPTPEIMIKTVDGRSLQAEFLGLDNNTGFTILRAPELKVEPPKFAEELSIDDAELIEILSPNFHFSSTSASSVATTSQSESSDTGEVSFFPTMKLTTLTGRLIRDEKTNQQQVVLARAHPQGRKVAEDCILLNRAGQVLGLTLLNQSAPRTKKTTAVRAINVVYPITEARQVATRIIKRRQTPKGWLGAYGMDLTQFAGEEKSLLGLGAAPETKGVVITGVIPQSPAAAAGLQPKDVLISFNHEPVTSVETFTSLLATTEVGQPLELHALREGKPVMFTVTLAPQSAPVILNAQPSDITRQVRERERAALRQKIAVLQNELINQQKRLELSQQATERAELEANIRHIRELLALQNSLLATTLVEAPAPAPAPRRNPTPSVIGATTPPRAPQAQYNLRLVQLGLATQELTDQLREFFSVPAKQGILITTVKADSLAAQAGFKAGDVLLQLNRQTINSAAQYRTAINNLPTSQPIMAVIMREGKRLELSFELVSR